MNINAKLLQVKQLNSGVRDDGSVWKYTEANIEFFENNTTQQIHIHAWGDVADHLTRLIPGMEYNFEVCFGVKTRSYNESIYYTNEPKCVGVH